MFENYKDVLSVPDLCSALGIGKNMAYKLLQNNQIQHIRIGKKYIIPKKSILDFIGDVCYNDNRIINVDCKNLSPKGVLQ